MNPADKMQLFWDCACGKTHRVTLGHYDRAALSCGRIVWALQPKRNEGLHLFPWPGPNWTAAELKEKEARQAAGGVL